MDLSNRQVASDLGMSESGISRLRSGARSPSLSKILLIAKQYGWSVDAQSKALAEGYYADAFNQVIQTYAEGHAHETSAASVPD